MGNDILESRKGEIKKIVRTIKKNINSQKKEKKISSLQNYS